MPESRPNPEIDNMSTVYGRIVDLQKTERRSAENDPISVREIAANEIEVIQSVYSLLSQEFKPGEVDPWPDFLACVTGKTEDGRELPIRYKIVSAFNSKNEIECVYVFGLTPIVNLENEDEIQTKNLLFTGFYILTTKSGKGKGLAQKLYISALKAAQLEAIAHQKKIVVVVGDVTDAAQNFWERMGRRKLYLMTYLPDDKVQVANIPYIQPSMQEGSVHTGVPENLMLELFNGTALSKKFLLSVVRTLYWWSKQQMFASSKTDSEKAEYVEILNQWLKEYEGHISEPGDLSLLTIDEIKEMKENDKFVFKD